MTASLVPSHDLRGTWEAEVTFVRGPLEGKVESVELILDADELIPDGDQADSPRAGGRYLQPPRGIGEWAAAEDRLTYSFYEVQPDPEGKPAKVVHVRAEGTVGAGGQTFTAAGTGEVYGTGGELIATNQTTVRATRSARRRVGIGQPDDPDEAGVSALVERPEDLRSMVGELSASAWALATLAAAVECGVVAALREPLPVRALAARAEIPEEVAEGLLGVLAALGLVQRDGEKVAPAPGMVALAGQPALGLLRADLRTMLLQSSAFVDAAKAGTLASGWSFTDADLLEAQGVLSAAPVPMLADRGLPALGDVSKRLAKPGAAFLDVGTGVARAAIAFAERYPDLRVVGLEPADAPLALAQRNVAQADLESRIELRPQLVQDLADEAAYELAWLPIVFMSTGVVEAALRTVLRALKPGGWVLVAVLAAPGADLRAALSRLRAVLWGSDGLLQTQVEPMLVQAGYDDVRLLPGPPGGTLTPIAARRPLT